MIASLISLAPVLVMPTPPMLASCEHRACTVQPMSERSPIHLPQCEVGKHPADLSSLRLAHLASPFAIAATPLSPNSVLGGPRKLWAMRANAHGGA